MRLVALTAWIAALLATTASAFTPSRTMLSAPAATRRCRAAAFGQRQQASRMSQDANDEAASDERKKNILAQESLNTDNLKASAEALKNWKPQDLDRIIADVDTMPAEQAAQFRAMGMDPEIMKQSMQMMKENPEMRETMAKMMESMTPEELMEQSRMAQDNIKNSLNPPSSVNAEIVSEVDDTVEEDDDDDDEEEDEPIELDPEVLDAMFRVGELMSEPPEGGVTFQAFGSIPPIAVLSGNAEDDLSTKELKECWSKGSLGATRVDRKGFERVWELVQDDFYSDIVEEARDRLLIRKKKKSTVVSATPMPLTTPLENNNNNNNNPMANVSPEELQNQIKNMKDEDLTNMFEQMSNMSPAEEERLKAMGVDPTMMKQSASMMKSNPMLRKAATMMMQNTSPENLMKASQEAQQKMASMSEEEKKRILDNLK
jgi:hypothetical protein